MIKNFLTKLLLFLTIISLILILYKRHDVLSIYNFNNLYFLIPTFLFILALTSMYMPKILKFYFSYLILAFLLAVYSIEIIYFSQNFKSQEKKKFEFFKENNLDSRERSELYANILLKKLNETLTVPPQNFLYENYPIFPLSGISKIKTIMCNESGYFNDYISDRYGFNNNDKIYDKKDIDSVFIGDSFLHGACVNNKDNLISNLKSTTFFKEKNILNLGYGGNGSLLNLATLKEYFPNSKNVKHVFWIYYEGNDLEELNNEISNKILIKYLNNTKFSQDLKNKQKEINKYVTDVLKKNVERGDEKDLPVINTLVSILGLDRVRNLFYSKFITNNKYKKNIELVKIFEDIVFETKKHVSDYKAQLIFVYIPSNFKSEGKRYYKNILNIIKKNNIKYLDLTNDNFIKDKNMYPKYGAHFNQNGYKVLSKKISLFMRGN